MKKIFGVLFVFGVLGLMYPPSGMAEELNYNLYSLQASVSRDIPNDLMVVTLVSTHQSKTAQEASDAVNLDMRWALDQIENMDGVSSRTEQYSTYPQYDRNQKITHWMVSQNLRLESESFEVLTDVVGDLQEKLQVQSMSFAVKPETRTHVTNELISEALAAYTARAKIVAESMQADSYELVNTNIDTQDGYSPIYARAQSMGSMSMLDEAVPVAVESGESTVTVSVNGQIQLDY